MKKIKKEVRGNVERRGMKMKKIIVLGGIILATIGMCLYNTAEATDFPSSTTSALTVNLDFNGKTISNIGDVITKGPWVDARAYSSINAAVTAIGTTKTTLLVPNEQILTASLTVPSNITLQILQGGKISKASTYVLTINGPFEAGPYKVFNGFPNGHVTFGPGFVERILPQWWGTVSNATTVDENLIGMQSAVDAAYTLSAANGIDAKGGTRVYLPSGTYAVDGPIILGKQSIHTNLWFEGDGQNSTVLVWKGGDTNAFFQIGPYGQVNNKGEVRIAHMTLENPAVSGSDITALRKTGIDGIQINQNISGNGTNGIVIEDIDFRYLCNGIVGVQNGVNQLNVTYCRFFVYNATNPAVNPYTDNLVSGRGNAIYFPSTTGLTVQGVVVEKCVSFNQAYFLDSQTPSSFGSLLFHSNYLTGSGFEKSKGIRLSMFTSISFLNNEFEPPNSSTHGPWLDLGTTALGSSNICGGSIEGNFFSSNGSSNTNAMVKLTYSKGVQISGNAFFNANKGIEFAGANVTDTYIGPNNWTTVTTKLTDGGSVRTTNVDDAIGSRSYFPTAVAVGANTASAGTFRMPYGGTVRSRNYAGTDDISLIYVNTAGTTQNLLFVGDSGQAGIVWNVPLRAIGTGATAALRQIGGSGPQTANQNSWMEVYDNSGNKFWVPVWK